MNALLAEVQASCAAAHFPEVTLISTLEPALPQVVGDGIQLQQVLLNLLLNDAMR